MTRVLDSNGVQLTRGMRVRLAHVLPARDGVVAATLGLEGVLVRFDGDEDDEYVDARNLLTVSAVTPGRRRR